MSGMIVLWLLVVLIDKCMNQTITYPDRQVIRPMGKTTRMKCDVEGSTTLHWYRAQSGGTLERIMYFDGGTAKTEDKFKGRFSGSKKDKQISLTISSIKSEDAGMYYCAFWSSDNWIKQFGSGTRLIVTESGKDKPEPPNLTAYPPAEKQSDKSTMLCQASGMFPDLVKFSWEMKSSSGGWTSVSDDKHVEQRNEFPDQQKSERPEVFVTSMMIVDKNTAKNNNYRCTVKHEGTTEPKTAEIIVQIKDEVKNSVTEGTVISTCPPDTNQKSETIDGKPSVYLFVYAYGIMLMKNGVYFAAVSIYLFKRRVIKKDESS